MGQPSPERTAIRVWSRLWLALCRKSSRWPVVVCLLTQRPWDKGLDTIQHQFTRSLQFACVTTRRPGICLD
jgi:hypothetical protein